MAITAALAEIRERIVKTCQRIGRNPDSIHLMAVSKLHPRCALEEAYHAGVRLFGENRVQEAAEKLVGFHEQHPDAEVHLIGSLQRNKVRTALDLFDAVQSVDRESLIDTLGNATAGRDHPLPVLFELHTGEDTKTGFSGIDSLFHATEVAAHFPGIAVHGLMTVAPFTSDEQAIRAAFRALAVAQKKMQQAFPDQDFSCLSMGMSGDFEIAIEEGSTLVRIGTALFGNRLTL
ncbi:YggS family pyridoxal phosphate enzyme [Spirochaetia bacterium]|nr:YggS family pyridoxal phosphate enzyme [Spirochaetia bacterium]GHU30791.1 YggS family pyridoxal phosphate enzyme [Spirochaetia bacterium]